MKRIIGQMKTKREHLFGKKSQAGNAMIYVLIAIVLFAALSMTLGRQTDTGEASDISDGKEELYATQIITYAAQAKSAIDQMQFSGTKIPTFDFTLPSQAGFNADPTITKVYHPDGGGLNPGTLPARAVDQNIADPVAGWYMGRFSNVEWTKTSAQDVILVAFQISERVCQKINEKVTGSTAIPQLTTSIRVVAIDDSIYAGGTNTDFMTDPNNVPNCAACHHKGSLCVEDSAGGTYGFISVLTDQ